ncbi:transposase [Corallococcus interemptor]|uniref:transposase n=1 Tax=Corallococcus interemptor TaxID=2316720 RepID=UPI003D06E7F3
MHRPLLLIYAQHFEGSVQGALVMSALRYFHREVGQPQLMAWDRLDVHRSREVKDFVESRSEDFVLDEFPVYSREFNPKEGCNSQVKRSMINATHESVADLRQNVHARVVSLRRRHSALRGFFEHARLSLRGLT